MFDWLTGKKRQQDEALVKYLEQMNTRLSSLEETNKTIVSENIELNTRLSSLEETNKTIVSENIELKKQAALADEKKNANSPWIAITSEGYDKDKGIAIGLDWNDAFIEHLKENGIKGSSEEDTVRKYLAMLYENLVDELTTEVEEQSSKRGNIGSYE